MLCPGVFLIDLKSFFGSFLSISHSFKLQQSKSKHPINVIFSFIVGQNLYNLEAELKFQAEPKFSPSF